MLGALEGGYVRDDAADGPTKYLRYPPRMRPHPDVLRLVDAELVGGGVVGVRPDPAAPPVLLLDRRANGPRAD